MEHSSNSTLVALSIMIVIFASFTALSLSGRIACAEPSARRWWILAAAMALGGGAWAMHFVGMLAMDMPAAYDVELTLLSVVLPIVVSGIGLHVVSRSPDSRAALASGGLIVGAGVVAMHYTGMSAIEMPGVLIRYDGQLVAASVAIAVAASTSALWLAFRTRGLLPRLAAAAAMGAAISGMHYTAMAGTNFVIDHRMEATAHSAMPNAILALAVVGAVSFLLLLALLIAFFERKLATLTAHEANALQQSEERHRLLVENASDIIAIVDGGGRFVYEGSSAMHILGYRSDEIVGRQLTDFTTPESVGAAESILASSRSHASRSETVELWLAHRSGERRAFEVVARNLLHAPSIAGVVLNLRDITERTALLARLEALSETDALTKALNRRGFGRLAEHEFKRARRTGRQLPIVMMDIDHFKQVNDRYGHAAGDLVLARVSEICTRGIRSGDVFGRLGGEEFAFLLPECGPGAARDIVNRLKAQIAACTVSTIKGELSVTASFGIVYADTASMDLASALSRADQALYEAKKAGRDCVKISA